MGCALTPSSVKSISPTQFEFHTLYSPPSGGTTGDGPGWSGPSRQAPHGCISGITVQMMTLISSGKHAQSSSQGDGGGGGDNRDEILRAVELLYLVSSSLL